MFSHRVMKKIGKIKLVQLRNQNNPFFLSNPLYKQFHKKDMLVLAEPTYRVDGGDNDDIGTQFILVAVPCGGDSYVHYSVESYERYSKMYGHRIYGNFELNSFLTNARLNITYGPGIAVFAFLRALTEEVSNNHVAKSKLERL